MSRSAFFTFASSAAIAVFSFTAVACSGGGGPGPASPPATSSTSTPTPTTHTPAPGISPSASASTPPGTTSTSGPTPTPSPTPLTFSLLGTTTLTETPHRAYDFVNSVGVNVNIANWATSSIAPAAAQMLALGVKHVRLGILRDDPTYDASVMSFLSQSQTSALGIANCAPPLGPNVNSAITAADIAAFSTAIGGRLEAYEAMNEPDARATADPTWVPSLITCMQSEVGAVAGDPFLAPAISDELSYANDVGNQTAIVNYGNFHRYLAGHNPDTSGYGSTFACGVYGALAWAMCEARIVSGNDPLAITEMGYSTTNEIDTTTQAKYLSRALFVNSNAGIVRTYVYTLVSYTNGDAFGGDGILNTDLSAKPAFTAIQSTLGVLNDAMAGTTPASVNYAISGAPASLEHELFEKSDGSYVLALWNETPSWNTTTDSPIAVASSQITVAFPFLISATTASSLSDAGSATTPNAIIGINGFVVPVDDHMTFVHFSKLL